MSTVLGQFTARNDRKSGKKIDKISTLTYRLRANITCTPDATSDRYYSGSRFQPRTIQRLIQPHGQVLPPVCQLAIMFRGIFIE